MPVSCLTFKSEEESKPEVLLEENLGFFFGPLSRKKRLNRWFVDVVWDVEVCRYNIMPCMRQKKGEGLPAALKKKKKKPEISSTFLSPSAVVMFGVVSS